MRILKQFWDGVSSSFTATTEVKKPSSFLVDMVATSVVWYLMLWLITLFDPTFKINNANLIIGFLFSFVVCVSNKFSEYAKYIELLHSKKSDN